MLSERLKRAREFMAAYRAQEYLDLIANGEAALLRDYILAHKKVEGFRAEAATLEDAYAWMDRVYAAYQQQRVEAYHASDLERIVEGLERDLQTTRDAYELPLPGGEKCRVMTSVGSLRLLVTQLIALLQVADTQRRDLTPGEVLSARYTIAVTAAMLPEVG